MLPGVRPRLATVAAVLLVVFLAATASMGAAVLDRTRAQTAADAAALASLDGGLQGGEGVAPARRGREVTAEGARDRVGEDAQLRPHALVTKADDLEFRKDFERRPSH